MKQHILLFALVLVYFGLNAQECPSAFKPYTTAEYIYSCQGDINDRGEDSHTMTQRLRRDALAALAEQFKVEVNNQSVSKLLVEDGVSAQTYTSMSTLTSDVTLKLAHTKETYDRSRKKGWAIAYIEKNEARQFYRNEYNQALGKIRTAIEEAIVLIDRGYKSKARDEKLLPAEPHFRTAHEAIAWLALFGCPEDDLQTLMDECSAQRRQMTAMLADLEHGTAIYIQCEAKLNGSPYRTFSSETKGQLEKLGCHFVESEEEADWIIKANADVTRTQHFQNMAFFCWVDGDVSIVNAATGKVVYENRISDIESGHPDGIKGNGGTSAYEPSARDAYRQAAKIIAKKAYTVINN